MKFRNNANTADLSALSESSDVLQVGEATNGINVPGPANFANVTASGTVTAAAISTGGDSFAGTPRMTWGAFLPGALSSLWTASQFTLKKAINVVQIDLFTNRAVVAETAPAASKANVPKPIVVVAPTAVSTATPTEALQIEATQTGHRSANGLVEVQLTVNWTAEPEAPLHVQQWRVEREDGAILSFGRERQFKPSLAVGRYKVEVRAQREENGPPTLARSRLTVSPTEAIILSQASARN